MNKESERSSKKSLSKKPKSLIYLMPNRGLFIGHIPLKIKTCQPSPVLIIGLNGALSLVYEKRTLVAKSFIIPAGVAVDIELHIKSHESVFVAELMLDRLDIDFQLLKANMSPFDGGIFFGFSEEAAFSFILKDAYRYEYALKVVFELLASKFRNLNFADRKVDADPRIKRVIDYLRANPHDDIPICDLAALASLSVSRLTTLFRSQVGVPIRKYRQWRRLYATAQGLANNKGLAEAALDAGFNDASHFCNNFKDMFGISPKYIFSKQTKLILK